MADSDGRGLVNPYHNEVQRGAIAGIGRRRAPRRGVVQVIVVLISLALVVGTVVTSCRIQSPAEHGRPVG